MFPNAFFWLDPAKHGLEYLGQLIPQGVAVAAGLGKSKAGCTSGEGGLQNLKEMDVLAHTPYGLKFEKHSKQNVPPALLQGGLAVCREGCGWLIADLRRHCPRAVRCTVARCCARAKEITIKNGKI